VIASNGAHSPAGAWVGAAAPVRVLIVAGAPDWESRFAARALEEAGALVAIAQPLGRGLAPARAPAGLPDRAGALEAWDVVIALPGAAAGAAQLRALREFVQAGGGVLAAGHAAVAQALGIARVDALREAGEAGGLAWSVPLEIAELPAASIAVPMSPLSGLPASVIPAAAAGDAVVLALGAVGRGRAAVLGLRETWRWRMEAGRIEEHRAFWRDLTDWLAGGLRDAVTVRVDPAAGAPGRMVTVTLAALEGDAPAALSLHRPDGTTESLPAVLLPHARASRSSFFAGAAGEYTVTGGSTTDGGAEGAAFAAEPSSAAPHAWARLALLAHASGGDVVPAAALGVRIDALDARAGGPPRAWAGLFAAIVALALAEWITRRVRGLR
jgi:hypothetical protein